jgi:hypothetical protein
MELFVRKLNLRLYGREFPSMSSSVAPSRRGFVNEVAFQLFVATRTNPSVSPETEANATSAARQLILGKNSSSTDTSPLNVEEMLDAKEQLTRLKIFFANKRGGAALELMPAFAGCGIVDSCNGDVYFGTSLFEVKAGDRNFRSIDLRQLLTYAALNYAQSKRRIEEIGLFNPRVGISFSMGIDELCLEVSGHPASHTLSEIIRAISSGEISR